MTFGLKNQMYGRKITSLALPTHSRIVNGNPVETCRPYPCDYMSETLLIYSHYNMVKKDGNGFFTKRRTIDFFISPSFVLRKRFILYSKRSHSMIE
jgi:hypothetical protein